MYLVVFGRLSQEGATFHHLEVSERTPRPSTTLLGSVYSTTNVSGEHFLKPNRESRGNIYSLNWTRIYHSGPEKGGYFFLIIFGAGRSFLSQHCQIHLLLTHYD